MSMALQFWNLLTRWGEAQILLPAVLLLSLPALRTADSRASIGRWWLGLAVATAITTATKLAFIGWGIGIASLNFTGISGHAMFAAAVHPMLAALLTSQLAASTQRAAFVGALVLALVVGFSRIEVGAHSLSEVIAGLALGCGVSAWATWQRALPRYATAPWYLLLIVVWLVITPVHTPQSQTHHWVTRLSLVLAEREIPHTRAELLKNSVLPLQ
jgi:membrane-associated phospholipid phosphatase